jgi:hypothetical protein
VAGASIGAAQQRESRDPVPPVFFGTWIWMAAQSHADASLADYQCYVERLEDLGGGKFRLKDHRIRRNNQVIRTDATLEFGVAVPNRSGTTSTFEVTGPRGYTITLKREAEVTFVVSREISADGRTMTHIGQGTLSPGGPRVRNDFLFSRSDGAVSGQCALD